MLESLRMSIGVLWGARRLGKSPEGLVTFTNALTEARHVLLIMPLDRREMLSTMTVIELLKKRFEGENIHVIADEHGLETMRLLPRSRFTRILESDVNAFFLPRKPFMEQLKRKPCDIAIDLNLDLVLPSAYICRESKARIRVGFARKSADTFYNLQIQPDPALSRKLIYDRLAKCLQMF
ncbi:MAG: hypothetical protein HY708_06045 [Ignavibacteriae bacterium]|nr:hypothetical protein [Ignavibacteriota bacterium]